MNSIIKVSDSRAYRLELGEYTNTQGLTYKFLQVTQLRWDKRIDQWQFKSCITFTDPSGLEKVLADMAANKKDIVAHLTAHHAPKVEKPSKKKKVA